MPRNKPTKPPGYLERREYAASIVDTLIAHVHSLEQDYPDFFKGVVSVDDLAILAVRLRDPVKYPDNDLFKPEMEPGVKP